MYDKLIVIEGTDCSGKETQSKKLVEKLINRGEKVKLISFPVYDSPTGKIVGGPLLGKPSIQNSFWDDPAKVDPKIASMYYAIDRYNMKDEILKYLDLDYYVILDRYTISNMAHQGARYETEDERFFMYQWIDKLEYWLLQLPKPDITILLNLPYAYCTKLNENQIHFNLDKKQDEHEQDQILNCFLELSSLYNWDVIDCVVNHEVKNIKTVHQEIVDLLKNKYQL